MGMAFGKRMHVGLRVSIRRGVGVGMRGGRGVGVPMSLRVCRQEGRGSACSRCGDGSRQAMGLRAGHGLGQAGAHGQQHSQQQHEAQAQGFHAIDVSKAICMRCA